MGQETVGLETWLNELRLSGYQVKEIDHTAAELEPSYLIDMDDDNYIVIFRACVPFDWPWSVVVAGPNGEGREIEFEEFDDMADWVTNKLREWDGVLQQ